jgi:hypothetical protein
MMFLDCPAYLDADGVFRCGLPAEVRYRYVVASTDGPLESAMIRCPAGHGFNGPIESLTWKDRAVHGSGQAGRKTVGSVRRARIPAGPRSASSRPNGAPAYYLGRPASLWIAAMTRPARHRATSPPKAA